MSGRYRNASGTFAVDFHAGNATVTMMGDKLIESPFAVHGDSIVVHGSGNEIVFTRNRDGSLNAGFIGELTRTTR